MDKREACWSISHDIIETFSRDFGPFKGMAEKVVYERISRMSEAEVNGLIENLILRLQAIDD